MKPVPVTPPRGRLFGARAVAQYLGVTESKARTLIATGELIAIRTAKGRLVGVYESDCEAWVAGHRQVPASRPGPVAVDERMKALLPKKLHFA